ncbi:MAG: DEAD/DEAH box helicase, partial [Deltaproteobacteria bacterium]|nr:DEAD/DEAH box helicase [Deltaproteobacteria bacterium]
MNRLSIGTLGDDGGRAQQSTSRFGLPDPWHNLLQELAPRGLRPVQQRLVAEGHLLTSRRNLVVIAPTNGGKSLVGDLIVLAELAKGRRAVVVEPLRALAQQRAAELKGLAAHASPGILPRPPRVKLTTGDYRLEHEDLASPPPGRGEIVVATPERVDAITRHAAGQEWLRTVGAVVIDEAHLVSDPRRGPTLEMVVARFKTLATPPRIVLLSATVGEPERLQAWLAPADLLVEHRRLPPLELEVWHLEAGDDPDALLQQELGEVLATPEAAALVFVYRRADAEVLAKKLAASGPPRPREVAAFHSGLSAAQRERTREAFANGTARVLVTTTALALGLNLPASHVYIRDSWFPGHGALATDQLLQMAGRAGRGDRAGRAAVLVRGPRGGDAEALAVALRGGLLPPIRSAFAVPVQRWAKQVAAESKAPACVAALLAQGG